MISSFSSQPVVCSLPLQVKGMSSDSKSELFPAKQFSVEALLGKLMQSTSYCHCMNSIGTSWLLVISISSC